MVFRTHNPKLPAPAIRQHTAAKSLALCRFMTIINSRYEPAHHKKPALKNLLSPVYYQLVAA
jgi:hypothetical protein